MKRTWVLVAAIAAMVGGGCHKGPVHSRVGVAVMPPPGRVIGFDPSVVGLPGAISDTVYDAAGIISWIKYGASNTAWRPVPVSQMVTGDPSQAPGLKAPIGFVVTMTDGSASWIKKTTSDTGWVVNPASGGGLPDGGIAVADGGGILGNGTSAPLSAVPQFGPDTQLFLPNDAGTSVVSWEGANTLTTKTAGNETSKYVLSLKKNGSMVQAAAWTPTQTASPDGTVCTVPGMSFAGDATTGFARTSVPAAEYICIGGVQAASFVGSDLMRMPLDSAHIVLGSASQGFFGMNGLAAQVGSTLADTELGVDGTVGTTATQGFVQMPSCAGTPTGVPAAVKSGKIATIIDSTNNKFCAYLASAWHCVAFP